MKQKLNFNLIGALIMGKIQDNTDRNRDILIMKRLQKLLISKMEKGCIIDRDKVIVLLNKAINETLDKE